MANTAKNAILKAKIESVITELMVKTNAENVYVTDDSTLSAKLTEIITALNAKATPADITTKVNALKDELLGDTPSDAYDTFTELAAYIKDHQEVSDALTAAVGNKADKTTVEAIQTTINGLGTLAKLSSVSESNLDSDLKTKIDNASAANHSHSNKTVLDGITSTKVSNWDKAATNSHTHSNKTALDTVTSAKITAWDAKANVYYSKTEPTSLTANDLWFQLVD